MRRQTQLAEFRRDGDAPLYSRVVAALRDEIATGRVAVGARLPSEEELCGRFRVSRHTVREALRKLREDGLVSSRQGAGTTVLRKSGAPPLYTHSVGSIDELVQYAVATRYRAKSTGAITAERDLAQRLGSKICPSAGPRSMSAPLMPGWAIWSARRPARSMP
jgi:DNA-binding GntR family transcriptional regulator